LQRHCRRLFLRRTLRHLRLALLLDVSAASAD
jgi:hypothetical protein